MTQDFQAIGKPSPELDAVASERQGWQGATSEPQIEELTDPSDFSFYDRRSNRQACGLVTPNAMQPVTITTAGINVLPVNPNQEGLA